MGSNCTRTIDVTHWTGTQQTRVTYNSTKETSSCIQVTSHARWCYRRRLCCVPVQCVTLIVRAQLLPIVCWFYRSAQGLILFLITCEHYLYLCIYSPFLLRLYLNIHKTRVFSSFLQLYDSIPGKLGLFVNLSWSTGILSILSGQQGISPSFWFQLPRDL